MIYMFLLFVIAIHAAVERWDDKKERERSQKTTSRGIEPSDREKLIDDAIDRRLTEIAKGNPRYNL